MVKDYKNNNIELNQISDFGLGASIADSHNKEQHALDTIKANSLVPKRYQKLELFYVDGTECDIETILYYGKGEYFSYNLDVRENPMGTAEISAVSFVGTLASSLDGKYFTIYDDSGSIGVWFNLNGTSTPPITGGVRDIEISISSGDSPVTLANKLELTMNSDTEFLASRMDSITVISSISKGNKPDATSETSGLLISINQGIDSLNNQYFITYSAEDKIKHYVWYNINSTGTDPMLPGAAGIEVNLLGSETREEIAGKTAQAIDSSMDFRAASLGVTIEIENYSVGTSTGYESGTTSFINYKVQKNGRDMEVIARLDFTYNINGNMQTVQRS